MFILNELSTQRRFAVLHRGISAGMRHKAGVVANADNRGIILDCRRQQYVGDLTPIL